MAADSAQRQALLQLGAATAEAVARTLEALAPGAVARGEVLAIPDGLAPFNGLPDPAVAASVSYVDGVTGANVFAMSEASVRALAAGMGVPPEEQAGLSELEMSAVGEAANQMLAAAAAAISVVIGQEIEISPPDVRVLESAAEAADIYGSAPYATTTTFTIGGADCRLIQLVPSAFVVRMARAIEERGFELGPDADAGGAAPAARQDGEAGGADAVSLGDALAGINLRVWAELGRTRLPFGEALELPAAALVELDCVPDAPVDLFVNGLCFGQGRLLVTDDGEWAIEVTSVSRAATRRPALLALAGAAADQLHEPSLTLNQQEGIN